MEDKKNIPYKKSSKNLHNSILEYYSPYPNENGKINTSELQKFKSFDFSQNSYKQIKPLNLNEIQNILSDEFLMNEKLYTQKNNNFRLKSEIVESNNNKKENKEIKKITPDDLLLTQVENRTILRVNPAIYINESYEFLTSNLYILLKDQFGCKFLQEKLEKDKYTAFSYFFPALVPNIKEFITDTFANYFIQKILVYLNESQMECILKILEPDFLDICIDSRGTRVVQSIMDLLLTEKLRKLFFDIIKPIFISLINEFVSTHIIYKFINLFPEYLEDTNNIIINNIIAIATHKRGCIFLQNYLTNMNKINLKNELIQALLKNCLILIIDQFGNYIIQYLLSLEDSNITLNIINQIINNISFYCKHKYANYVIEKIFIHSNYTQKQTVIQKISSPEIIKDLAFDHQGNFIILKSLNFADDEKRNLILKNIDNLKPQLEQLSNGKKFLNKIEKYSKIK
jgi:hypothetical protein